MFKTLFKHIKLITFCATSIALVNCSSINILSIQKELSKTYSDYNNCQRLTCINEIDPEIKQVINDDSKEIRQIFLIRHAKPQLKKKLFYSSKLANQYIYNYNTAPIVPIDTGSVKNNLTQKHTILCSNLRRSKETAFYIFKNEHKIVSDSLFREFENKIIKAPSIIKLPLPVWQVISRGTWALGAKRKGIESYKEAKNRAKNATLRLIKNSKAEETSILVAHGMLNGVIKKNLKRKGWSVIQDKGKKNLGATILIKVYQ